MRARRGDGVEKRTGKLEVRRAVRALLEMDHDALTQRLRHGTIQVWPELANHGFTFGSIRHGYTGRGRGDGALTDGAVLNPASTANASSDSCNWRRAR